MKIFFSLFIAFAALPLLAQSEVTTSIGQQQATQVIRIGVPFPDLAPGLDPQTINNAFFAPLTRDLAASGVFAIAPSRTAGSSRCSTS